MKAFTGIRFYKWVIALMALLFYGCQEDPFDGVIMEDELSQQQSPEVGISAISVKEEFLYHSFDSQLYNNFNDTSKIYWEPVWEETSWKEVNDSISFVYVPLVAKLLQSDKNIFISEVDAPSQQRFIIARHSGSETEFNLATYLLEENDTDKDGNLAKTGIDLNKFTGLLLLHNFKTDEGSFISYSNGIPENQAEENKEGISSGTNGNEASRSSRYVCTYIRFCDWVSNCSQGVTVTSTRGMASDTPLYDCAYPYPSSGCQGSVWTRTRSYVEQYCSNVSDPPPPPPDHYLSPGRGGNGNPNAPSNSQLLQAIANKPFALFPDIPCEIVQEWIKLANAEVNATLKEKVNNLVGTVTINNAYGMPTSYSYTADVLDINNAYSSVVNMDYFSVKVNRLPVINGERASPQQFLNKIRTDINSFVNTRHAEFSPYNHYGVNDQALWNSSNPTGAIVSIDIQGPLNGSVITSSFTSDSWTFSTLKDPWNSIHPVSGNREFGYVANADGSYTFYTRGVDRITDPFTTLVQSLTGLAFGGSDDLWASFQEGISNYVNMHGGSASVNEPLKYRPSWSQVKEVADGNKPLSTLSDDCD